MSTILEGIKTFIHEGGRSPKVIKLEASALTNISGVGKGGRTDYSDAYQSLRYVNPFRMGAMQKQAAPNTTAYQWVAKIGNQASGANINPWGYTQVFNTGTPNVDTVIWQLPIQVVAGTLPIRDAVLSDVEELDAAVEQDILWELSTIEAQSQAQNNDQLAYSATNIYGTNAGLRGFLSYPDATAAAWGSSGTASSSGLHSIATVAQGAAAVSYNDIANLVNALPGQFWLPQTTFHIHPTGITNLRQLKDTNGLPLFIETGEETGGAVGRMFGFNVVPNPYLQAPGAGNYWLYLAYWPRFLCYIDRAEIEILPFRETTPGQVVLWFQKRCASSVYDPFAGCRLRGV